MIFVKGVARVHWKNNTKSGIPASTASKLIFGTNYFTISYSESRVSDFSPLLNLPTCLTENLLHSALNSLLTQLNSTSYHVHTPPWIYPDPAKELREDKTLP